MQEVLLPEAHCQRPPQMQQPSFVHGAHAPPERIARSSQPKSDFQSLELAEMPQKE